MTAMLLWRNLKNERNFNNYGIPSSHGRDDRGLLFPHHPSGKQAQKAGGADAQQPEKGDRVTTIGGMVGKIVQVNDSTIVFETSEDRVRIEVTKWAVQSTGAMEQAAAQKSGKKADKVEEKAEETPAVEEKATETVEAPAAEEKPSYDPEIK